MTRPSEAVWSVVQGAAAGWVACGRCGLADGNRHLPVPRRGVRPRNRRGTGRLLLPCCQRHGREPGEAQQRGGQLVQGVAAASISIDELVWVEVPAGLSSPVKNPRNRTTPFTAGSWPWMTRAPYEVACAAAADGPAPDVVEALDWQRRRIGDGHPSSVPGSIRSLVMNSYYGPSPLILGARNSVR